MRNDLLVLDDFFPHLLTGFRIAEYNAYLEASPKLSVLSAHADFEELHELYAQLYPHLASRVGVYDPASLAGCRLAYVNFLNNAALFLPDLERHGVPFLLTLYPGGGLGLSEAQSDEKLLRVLSSPLLKAVTVTVPATRDYLLDFMQRHDLAPKALHLVRGVVVNPAYFTEEAGLPASHSVEAAVVRICFVAEKYMPQGRNKGYPDFVEAAVGLARWQKSAKPGLALEFHVVGSFGPEDVDVSELGGSIHFHGRLDTGALQRFLASMDLLVSPNRPGLLHSGNFDGFPTGAAVEASLCGVALMVTDPLGQNPGFVAGQSFWPIPTDSSEPAGSLAPPIVAKLVKLFEASEPLGLLRSVGLAGRALSRKLYAPGYQIGVRWAALQAQARAVGLELSGYPLPASAAFAGPSDRKG